MRENLKNNLITGILSCPIIYIPHYHHQLVDEVIEEIISPKTGSSPVKLKLDQICEFNTATSVLKFRAKVKDPDERCTLEGLLDSIVVGSSSDVNDCELFILKNIGKLLDDVSIQSYLQLFAEKYERGQYDRLKTIIIISPLPVSSLPPELEDIITVVDIEAPTADEIREYVSNAESFPITAFYKSEKKRKILLDDICRNLQGLQFYDVKQILSSAVVRTGGKLSDKTKGLVLEEKKRVVRKSGIIEVIDADVSFKDIGGLEKLQKELKRKAVVYRHIREAQENNLPLPKGILIIGMPGCGKSMIAKAVAQEFGVSLLRLDISRLMGQYVGQSEANLRKALATAEAAHPCVLWIDEIEKAFAGSTGKGGDDMLVMRLMGHFLTWMQERRTPVYIVATANDVMRPEFMRKGRFDDVYFVNFPTAEERKEIFMKKLEKYQRSDIFDTSDISEEAILRVKDISKKKTDEKYDGIVVSMEGIYGGFSGAEIESVVNSVFEKKFVEYMDEASRHDADENYTPEPRKITAEDFTVEVKKIKDSAMANQHSDKVKESDVLDRQYREKTNIERILDMQSTYKFTPATEGDEKKK